MINLKIFHCINQLTLINKLIAKGIQNYQKFNRTNIPSLYYNKDIGVTIIIFHKLNLNISLKKSQIPRNLLNPPQSILLDNNFLLIHIILLNYNQ